MTVLVVDAANVIGSVPDGWWKDRARAARRLHAGLAGYLGSGACPFTTVVLVLEGAARAGVPAGADGGLVTAHAPASGDDEIVTQCRALTEQGEPVAVATADRGLIGRLRDLEVEVLGPRTLRAGLPST